MTESMPPWAVPTANEPETATSPDPLVPSEHKQSEDEHVDNKKQRKPKREKQPKEPKPPKNNEKTKKSKKSNKPPAEDQELQATDQPKRAGLKLKRSNKTKEQPETGIDKEETQEAAPKFSFLKSRSSQHTKTKKSAKAKRKFYVLDGTSLFLCLFKGNKLTEINKTSYDTHKEAASSIPKRSKVIWASGHLSFSQTETSLVSAVEAIKFRDAEIAETQAHGNTLYLRASRILGTLQDPLAMQLKKRRCVVYPSSVCVDVTKSGYWLRIGQEIAEATVVDKGQIVDHVAWPHLGTSTARAKIADSEHPPEAIQQMVREIGHAVTAAHSDWLARGQSSDKVFLHGQGSRWGGLENTIRDGTSCLIVPAPLPLEATTEPDLAEHEIAVLATQALSAQPMLSSAKILRTKKRRSQLLSAAPYALVVGVISAIMGWSWWQANTIRDRVTQAETRQQAAEAATNLEAQARANEALEVQSYAELLTAEDPYPWREVADYLIEIRKAEGEYGGNISQERCESVSVYEEVSPWFSGIEEADARIRALAEELYGEEVEIENQAAGTSFEFDILGGTEISYTFTPTETICGVIPTNEQ